MSSRQKTFQKLSRRMRPPSKLFCRTHLPYIRQQSTAATTVESSSTEPPPAIHNPPQSHINSSTTSPRYRLKASVLLSRPPLLTRDLTPFEKAHFLYQKRLNERLALPFSRYFHYQKGTPGDVEWKRKIKERKSPAREIGPYNGYGKEAWNDELLVGDDTVEPLVQLEKLVNDAQVSIKARAGEEAKKDELERPKSRVTEADEKGDKGSLNRLMTRTLYLLVKNKEQSGRWKFPVNELLRDESLHKAAERIIVQTGGINMNTWVVGNMPIGHHIYNYGKPDTDAEQGIETLGEKVFYMKARIMAGKPDLKDNSFDLAEYQWLAKEEIQQVLGERDWRAVKNVLAER